MSGAQRVAERDGCAGRAAATRPSSWLEHAPGVERDPVAHDDAGALQRAPSVARSAARALRRRAASVPQLALVGVAAAARRAVRLRTSRGPAWLRVERVEQRRVRRGRSPRSASRREQRCAAGARCPRRARRSGRARTGCRRRGSAARRRRGVSSIGAPAAASRLNGADRPVRQHPGVLAAAAALHRHDQASRESADARRGRRASPR